MVMCLAGASAVFGADPAPAPKADALAAEGLYHSVMLLRHASDKPTARAARLVGLAEFARRLAPDNPNVNNAVAYLSLIRNKDKELTRAIAKSFAARPGDHGLGLQWLASEMKARQDAPSRLAFLGELTADVKRTPELRAAAAVHQADILIGQGLREKAVAAFDAAIKLDPNLNAAITGRLALAEKASPADRAKIWARQLIVNPHLAAQAAKLGEMLDAAGLYKQAARFYDYAWKVNRRAGGGRNVSLPFAEQYCNALLNAGEYKKACDIFGPLSRRFSESVLLRVLLIEACNNSAQKARAKMYAREIETLFASKMSGGRPNASAAAELAWLHLITGDDIDLALEYARRAQDLKPNAPETVRALAAAQLVSRKRSVVDIGRTALQKIADKDVFAKAFLAEYYFQVARTADGKKMVLSGLQLSRSGQAARRLTVLAKKHKITVPPPEGAKELQAVAESVPEKLLELGLSPEKHFALKATAPKQIDAGDGIVVSVELSGKYDGSVAVGLGGLLPATVSLDVSVKGRQGGEFKDVARLTLPAGRYITAGKKVSVSGRIDVGKLQDFLIAHPLDDLQLTVSPRLIYPGAKTPAAHGKAPPALTTPSAAIVARTGVLGKFDKSSSAKWRSRYAKCLSLIMGDLIGRDTRVRLRAANQIASLISLADGIKSGDLSPPSELSGRINRSVLILMAAEAIKNRSDIVRAEMLAALGQVKLDAAIIRSLGGVIRDKSPLVRFRLVELLGASGMSGQEPILKHFAKDKYDLVANLAKAMQAAQ